MNEDLLLRNLQNGISQEAKLELLKDYKGEIFGDGYNYCLQVLRKNKEIKKAEIRKRTQKLIDKLREEIWNNETHHQS